MHKSRLLFVNTQEVRCGRCKAAVKRSSDYVVPDCAHRSRGAWSGFSTDYLDHSFSVDSTYSYPHGGMTRDLAKVHFVPRSEITWQ